MRVVGEVVRTAQGLAVLRSDDDGHPDIGTPVVDERLETVGQVVDILGPLDRPEDVDHPADRLQSLVDDWRADVRVAVVVRPEDGEPLCGPDHLADRPHSRIAAR